MYYINVYVYYICVCMEIYADILVSEYSVVL